MYKIWVLATGEKTWATNGLEFDTIDDAKKWGDGLMMRWFGASKYAILPVSPEFKGFLDHTTIQENSVYNY